MKPNRLALFAVPLVLLLTGLSPAAPALASQACGGSGTMTSLSGALPDGATYLIQCPAVPWNGTLFLYSHGYVAPGSPNPAQDVGDPVTGGWLLSHGFALAGSSYASTGWAIQQALPDQAATLDAFGQAYRTPDRTIAWGHSLGGIITAGLIQRYPGRFSAALPMCGVLSGAVATWDTALDAEFAFQQLVDPSVQVVNITNPAANLAGAQAAVTAAQQTARGRARIALAAALGDTPGWFTPLSPEPAPGDATAQEANQFLWDTNVDFPFIFAFRAELEARAGGNPSWNTGVNYFAQLARSADLREVVALYHAAGLSLARDLQALDRAPRISASAAAVSYLERNIAFDGRLPVPVLTMHTTGDGLVVPENEQAYRSVADRAGDGGMLQQIFVHRAGHCAFTPAETITAVQVLLSRLGTGHWDGVALDPGYLNAQAAALGPAYNIFSVGGTVYPTAPGFVRYWPTPYPRPFDLLSP
ncbi:MAG: alpha/beta hydrolase family protein [Streptosporangiales bacterium]